MNDEAVTMSARKHLTLYLSLTCFALLLGGYWYVGPRHGFDSDDYQRLGRHLFAWIQDPSGADQRLLANPMFPSYIVPAVLLEGCYRLFGSAGHAAAVVLNAAIFSALLGAATSFGHRLAGIRPHVVPAIAFALYLGFGLPAVPLWVYYDLSDVIFFGWTGATVLLLLSAVRDDRLTAWTAAAVLAVAALFVRPTGIALLALILAALALRLLPAGAFHRKTPWFAGAAALICATLLLYPALIATLIELTPRELDALPGALRSQLQTSAHYYEVGWVVADRPETYVSNPSGYLDYLLITVLRFGYYFTPFRQGYSPIHTILNATYIAVAIPLAVIGLRYAWNSNVADRRSCLLLVTVALGFGLLHAITLNSYDWRYQLPAMVPLWILATTGGWVLLARLRPQATIVQR